MEMLEYIIISLFVVGAFYYLIRKFKKEIKKGQCASCPLYDKCESKEKI